MLRKRPPNTLRRHSLYSKTMANVCDLTLLHYSAILLKEITSFAQQELLSAYGKPKGLWVSVESDEENWLGWREWCQIEQFALDKFEHATRIHLKDDAEIKLVSDDKGISEFNEQFSRAIPGYPDDGPRGIDWKYVTKSWSGMIISPYICGPRPGVKPSWYYAWHCASGCIWDANAISFVEGLSSFKRPARHCGEAARRSVTKLSATAVVAGQDGPCGRSLHDGWLIAGLSALHVRRASAPIGNSG
ncbi:MAG: hypothetical protein WBX25_32665, partial [Rhodomicrobium sp.]